MTYFWQSMQWHNAVVAGSPFDGYEQVSSGRGLVEEDGVYL